jgi:hypothetical protein
MNLGNSSGSKGHAPEWKIKSKQKRKGEQK